MVRVMIVDDQALMGRVVREMVEKENDLEMLAEACNGYEAETLAAQTQPDVVLKGTTQLLEGLRKAKNWLVRCDSARFLGWIGQADEVTLDTLWRGLLDENAEVRTACAQALAQLGKRFPTIAQSLATRLIAATQDPEFNKPDWSGRPAYAYAYDGLWLLVVGGEFEQA